MPQNWKTYKLEELSERVCVGFVGTCHKYYRDNGIGVPMIRTTNLSSKGLDLAEVQYIDSEFHLKQKKSQLRRGDILIARHGTNGQACLYDLDEEANCLNVVIVRPNQDKTDYKWLLYAINSPVFRNQVDAHSTGSVQKVVNTTALAKFDIETPPLPEQRAIASILSSLDDKIELNLQMNKTLEEMAMTLYKHWFVDFEFSPPFQGGVPEGGGGLEAGYKSSGGKFIDSELGPIPEGWEVKGILEIVDLLSGGTPKTTIDEYWNGNICWVSAKDIGNGGLYINDTEKKITELGVSKSATKILPEDTIILVARGSVGKYGMIAKEMAMNQSCYGLFSKSEYSQGLVYLMLSELIEQFKRMAYGSVFDTITTSTFNSTKIVVPPTSIIETLKFQVDPLFDQVKQNILENESLTNLRDTLLPKLISGAVRVKDVESQMADVL